MLTAYLGQFSVDTEPADDLSLGYADWVEFRKGLDLYRRGDERSEAPLVAMFEEEDKDYVKLEITTGPLDHYGWTKPYLTTAGRKFDLSKDVELENIADVLGVSDARLWTVEATIDEKIIDRRNGNWYTIAHTINHEMSLHVAPLLRLFNEVHKVLGGSQQSKVARLTRVHKLLMAELLDDGPCTAGQRHKMFVQKMDENWRIVVTHNEMKALLADDPSGTDALERDFRQDRAARAAELGLPDPGVLA